MSLDCVVLNVQTPSCSWCHWTTAGRPDLDVRVRSHHALPGGRAVEEVEIRGDDLDAVLADLRRGGGADDVEVVHRADGCLRVRLTVPSCPLGLAVRAAGVAPQFPFPVANGRDTWTLVTRRDKARAFRDALDGAGVDAEVIYAGEFSPDGVLTERQREVLHAAVEAGFYDYPRRTTLTALAGDMGLAKSTLSQLLMQIERDLLGRLVERGEVRLDDVDAGRVGNGGAAEARARTDGS